MPLSGFGQHAEKLSEAVLNVGGLTRHTTHSFHSFCKQSLGHTWFTEVTVSRVTPRD